MSIKRARFHRGNSGDSFGINAGYKFPEKNLALGIWGYWGGGSDGAKLFHRSIAKYPSSVVPMVYFSFPMGWAD